MLKLIRTFIFSVFIIFLALGSILFFARTPIVEKILSKEIGSKVSIENVRLGWNRVILDKICIKNPYSKDSNDAFHASSVLVFLNPLTFFSQPRHIENVKIENPSLYLELYNYSGSDNNWSHILRKFPKEKTNKKFIIDKLTISNLSFHAVHFNGKVISPKPLSCLEMQWLGPFTLSVFSKVTLESMLSTLTSKKQLGAVLDEMDLIPLDLDPIIQINPWKRIKAVFIRNYGAVKKNAQSGIGHLRNFFSSQTE